jgi:hypothetical protein
MGLKGAPVQSHADAHPPEGWPAVTDRARQPRRGPRCRSLPADGGRGRRPCPRAAREEFRRRAGAHLDGEELVGAKQNRIVTILVAPQSEIVIPVSCIEAGRWGYSRLEFAAGGRVLNPEIRESKAEAVTSNRVRRAISVRAQPSQEELLVGCRVRADFGQALGVRAGDRRAGWRDVLDVGSDRHGSAIP